jgi:hypothetical protein
MPADGQKISLDGAPEPNAATGSAFGVRQTMITGKLDQQGDDDPARAATGATPDKEGSRNGRPFPSMPLTNGPPSRPPDSDEL